MEFQFDDAVTSGTAADVVREQRLLYPRISLGKKQPKRDPELWGKADYICTVDNLVRWTLEAKAPACTVDDDAIDQAFTYANHPEVRAVYFALFNGHRFTVHQTQHGPDAPAIADLSLEELETRFYQLEGILGPDALRNAFPQTEPDVGEPLGPGLRSVERIASGFAVFYLRRPNPFP